MIKKGIPALIAVMLFSAALSAKTVKYKDCGVSFTYPGGLKASQEDFGWSLQSKDEDLGIVLMCLDGKDMDTAGQEMDKQIKQMIPDFKENKSDEGEFKLNGMKAFTAGGSGTMEEHKVEVGVLMVVTPKGKVLTMFGIIQSEASKKYEPILEKFFKSIKPVK